MSRQGGLLLVERYPTAFVSSNAHAAEWMRRYRGFDGIAWPGETVREIALADGLAPLAELPTLLGYYGKIADRSIDLIYCAFDEMISLPGFTFVGFDVGYYESEYSHFSVVLNEIVAGSLQELRTLASSLNESMLVPTEVECAAILDLRARLLSAGADLERGEEQIGIVRVLAVEP